MLDLNISGRSLNHPPTDTDVNNAVQSVLDGREEFVILENPSLGVTLQLTLPADGLPYMEFIEDPPGFPVAAATEALDPTTLKRIFTYLLHSDPRWRGVVTWHSSSALERIEDGRGGMWLMLLGLVMVALIVVAILAR